MNEYSAPSNAASNLSSQQWASSAAASTNQTFSNYTLSSKWAPTHTSSQSSTPTNPSALTATFPSFSGAIPPLYPSISAQSSNAGGGASPFGTSNLGHTPTNASSGAGHTYSFNATNCSNNNNNSNNNNAQTLNTKAGQQPNSSSTITNSAAITSTQQALSKNASGGHSNSTSQSISQSSSSSSLTALTGGLGKLHINTSYNPYSNGSGFTPYATAGAHTPTGNNSQANTPNPGNNSGLTPTGFRFSHYGNPYSSIATPPTPANANGFAMNQNPFGHARINAMNSNNLQAQAAMNNLNAMNLPYRMKIAHAPFNTASTATIPTLSNPPSINNLTASSSASRLLHSENRDNNTPTNKTNNACSSTSNSNNNNNAVAASSSTTTTTTTTSSTVGGKLNSNAQPYQPSRLSSLSATTTGSVNASAHNILSQQLQHLQKADRVPYTYPGSAAAAATAATAGTTTTTATATGTAGGVQPVVSSSMVSYAEAAKLAGSSNSNKVNAGSMPNDSGDGNNSNGKSAAGNVENGGAMSSESEEAIQKLNPVTWPANPQHAKFYVIKSFGEDDVHKSIKYNLWCSTERGNRKLDEAFNESKRINAANHKQPIAMNESNAANSKKLKNKQSSSSLSEYVDARDTVRGCPVYLFFSVNRSGCFCGMAQMISNYYKDRHFGSWVQDGKWQGSFIVKWIYVKDIPNKDLKDIQLPNNDNRPVTFSRDTQEIPFNQGVEMLKRFIKYEPKTNILQDFKYYDDRERDIKQKRTQQIILQQLQQQQQLNLGPPPQQQQQQQQAGAAATLTATTNTATDSAASRINLPAAAGVDLLTAYSSLNATGPAPITLYNNNNNHNNTNSSSADARQHGYGRGASSYSNSSSSSSRGRDRARGGAANKYNMYNNSREQDGGYGGAYGAGGAAAARGGRGRGRGARGGGGGARGSKYNSYRDRSRPYYSKNSNHSGSKWGHFGGSNYSRSNNAHHGSHTDSNNMRYRAAAADRDSYHQQSSHQNHHRDHNMRHEHSSSSSSSASSQYGNFQILARKNDVRAHMAAEQHGAMNASNDNHNNNTENEHDHEVNSPNRSSRYNNRNRNRWVQKT